MGEAILTDVQEKALDAVFLEPRLHDFYLSGGTALAERYLHHRYSDDLDLFSERPVDGAFVQSFVSTLAKTIGAKSTRFERLYDRHIFFLAQADGELKIEFTSYPFPRLEPIIADGTMRFDSLRDLAANKLMALLDRFDPKDFVDIHFLARTSPLAAIRRDAEKKFGKEISALFLGSELAKVRRIEALPRMLVPLTIFELKAFFEAEAKKLAG